MAAAVRLPVSGREVSLRLPSGAEDLLLVEAGTLDVGLALELALRLGVAADGAAVDWAALPAADLDAWLLALRRRLRGDLIHSSTRCPTCGERIDISFTVSDYLRHHQPRRSKAADAGGGWLELGGVRFRPPTVGDQLAAAAAPAPEDELLARCIDGKPARALRRRVEAALDAVAPCLADELAGACCECGAAVAVPFDPVAYVLRELRDAAVWIYQDVHVIASSYGWREADILALPAERRLRYAELARSDRGAA